MSRQLMVHQFVLLLLWSGQIAWSEPLPFPPSYHRYVNDTTTSILDAYQKRNKEGLRNIINRDPLIARKALINLLRQPDKLEPARSLAEFFPESCESELEKSLFDFFLGAGPEIRKKLLDAVEMATDAEYTRFKRDSRDRFTIRISEQAKANIRQAAEELQVISFVDGEAYCLSRWAVHPYSPGVAVNPGLEAIQRALALYEESGNPRGQSFCLLHLAQGTDYILQKKDEATRLFLLACEKGRSEGALFGSYLNQYWHLAEKTPVEWLKESEALVEKDPALRSSRYRIILDRYFWEQNTTGLLPGAKLSTIGIVHLEKFRNHAG